MKRTRAQQAKTDPDPDHERLSTRRRRASTTPTAPVVPSSVAHTESPVTLQGSEDEDDGEETQGSKQKVPTPAAPLSQEDENTSEESKEPESWGFVIYRTVYGNDEEWQFFKGKLWEHVERKRDAIEEVGGDPDGVTFDFIEDEPELDGATAEQVRLRHDPSYISPAIDPEASEYQVVPSDRDDGLCGAGFLMIDKEAMESVIRHPAKGEPYVVAVDAINNHYEEGVFDGTMKIHADEFLTRFYLQSIKDNALVMGELPGSNKEDVVWSGLFSTSIEGACGYGNVLHRRFYFRRLN